MDTFTANDWDSDIEDSNSSEEFLYAKGASQIGLNLRSVDLRSTHNTSYPLDCQEHLNESDDEKLAKPVRDAQETTDDKFDTQDIWNSHEDLIAVATNGKNHVMRVIV